jgi:hypothetical protein
MRKPSRSMSLILALLTPLAVGAQTQASNNVRHIQDADRPVATGV